MLHSGNKIKVFIVVYPLIFKMGNKICYHTNEPFIAACDKQYEPFMGLYILGPELEKPEVKFNDDCYYLNNNIRYPLDNIALKNLSNLNTMKSLLNIQVNYMKLI